MANYYNINRSLEAYELRLIDPDDGQLKSIFDIPSIGSSGGQGGYTDLEIDNLVNAKLNIDNPDVNGTLRAGAGGSGGKIIINAGSTPESESFYVNGLSTFNGTVKVPVLEASSNIKTSQQVQTKHLQHLGCEHQNLLQRQRQRIYEVRKLCSRCHLQRTEGARQPPHYGHLSSKHKTTIQQ